MNEWMVKNGVTVHRLSTKVIALKHDGKVFTEPLSIDLPLEKRYALARAHLVALKLMK